MTNEFESHSKSEELGEELGQNDFSTTQTQYPDLTPEQHKDARFVTNVASLIDQFYRTHNNTLPEIPGFTEEGVVHLRAQSGHAWPHSAGVRFQDRTHDEAIAKALGTTVENLEGEKRL